MSIKVKWWGGGYAYPYLWKENKADTEYKVAWNDPRNISSPKVEKVEKQVDTAKNIKKKPKPENVRGNRWWCRSQQPDQKKR
ncbi:MAG: hypothetical protein LBV71_09855 [Prevotella sp.]|nr:hypothetical protein [Prevotella sp.]